MIDLEAISARHVPVHTAFVPALRCQFCGQVWLDKGCDAKQLVELVEALDADLAARAPNPDERRSTMVGEW